jgi:antitoxin HicB
MKRVKVINPEFVGQDFDEFLKQDGIAAEVEARAIKKVVVALLEKAGMTQVELAERLQTSRTQVRRLLDPANTSITLSTLQRAAEVTGHRLVIGFEPARRNRRRATASRERVAV